MTDLDGVRHAVEVEAQSVFEAAAAALAAFRAESWASAALRSTSVLHVQVQAPAVVHEVTLKALDRWAGSPSTSPKALLAKRLVRKP